MKKFWGFLEILIYGFLILAFLDRVWSSLREANPALDLRGLLEHQEAGLWTGGLIVLFATILIDRVSRPLRRIDHLVNRWQESTGPGPEASPIDAFRFFPVHTIACILLVIATVFALWTHVAAAMPLLVLTLMGAITLARRLGLEPPNDPAAPHNRKDA